MRTIEVGKTKDKTAYVATTLNKDGEAGTSVLISKENPNQQDLALELDKLWGEHINQETVAPLEPVPA